MKTSLIGLAVLLLLLVACDKKDPVEFPSPAPAPAMRYLDLGDQAVGFNHYSSSDLDGNGTTDFSVTTTLVGSPANRCDYQCYYFNGAFYSYTPVDNNEQMPILAKGDKVGPNSFPQHEWYNASQLLLSQRVIPVIGGPYWDGGWKDASHHYVAISLLKNEKFYYGWVEISFNTRQAAVILHRAAICEEAGREIKAGF